MVFILACFLFTPCYAYEGSGEYNFEGKGFEQILAEWIASPRPPEKRWSFSNAGMTEEDCAIIKATKEGRIAQTRLDSYRAIRRVLKEKKPYES